MASENLPGESRASQVQAACIAFFVLSPIFVGLRVWARVKVRSWSGLSWDDGVLFASWIFSLIMGALIFVASTYGLGRRIVEVSPTDLTNTLRFYYIADIFFKLTINLTKASVLLLYVRRFVTRWFTIACYVMLGIVLSFMVATTVVTIAQCTPLSAVWDVTAEGGTCINGKGYWYANSGFDIVTNVILLALPFQPIHASFLPGGQKIALILVFALGMFTTVTSILRMQTYDRTGSLDPTFTVDPAIWTIIEANLAIICACVPVFRPLLADIFPGQFSRSTIKPADNRRHTLAVRSETSLAGRLPGKKGTASKPGSTVDLEKGGWDEDLPLPPSLKDPNGAPRRSSMLREAYVWMSTIV
jgi:hypothetical protein